MRELVYFISMLVWMHGLVLAEGFWQTFFGIVVFPYSYYMVVKYYLIMFGLI